LMTSSESLAFAFVAFEFKDLMVGGS
jgi:hypothetical protein